ncbi:MAG: MerR family transcriptional regulator [Solirubrobacterales bacterium]
MNAGKTTKKPANGAVPNGTSAELTGDELTIDELAQKTGMTVRNIRAHQSRGLLPAPVVKGRIGYYDERHIARLELIQQLQAGGFNLTAIQRLVERAEETGDDIGNLRNLVLTPFTEEQTEVVNLIDLAQQVGVEVDSKLLKQAIDLGFVVPLGGDRFEVISPTVLRAGVRAVELGVPMELLFEVFKEVNRHTAAIAAVFTKMVDDGIVRPEERNGLPPESFPKVVTAIEGLRPLAAEVVLAGFKVNMDSAAEEAFGKILNRISRESLKHGSGHGQDGEPEKRSRSSRRRR